MRYKFLYYLHNVLNMLLYIIMLLNLFSFVKNWKILLWAKDVFILLFNKFLILWLMWIWIFYPHELIYIYYKKIIYEILYFYIFYYINMYTRGFKKNSSWTTSWLELYLMVKRQREPIWKRVKLMNHVENFWFIIS